MTVVDVIKHNVGQLVTLSSGDVEFMIVDDVEFRATLNL